MGRDLEMGRVGERWGEMGRRREMERDGEREKVGER